jgi:twitching motility two-component system response regulator PilH
MGNPKSSGTTKMSAEIQRAAKSETINKILVAEDSKTEQVHLRQPLESSGYEVKIVESGTEVIQSLDNFKPDLILMDIIMEGGDGYQACRKLKRNDDTKDIPVIMVSSKNNEVDRKWALKLGALDYIVKPYVDADLLQRLSEV